MKEFYAIKDKKTGKYLTDYEYCLGFFADDNFPPMLFEKEQIKDVIEFLPNYDLEAVKVKFEVEE